MREPSWTSKNLFFFLNARNNSLGGRLIRAVGDRLMMSIESLFPSWSLVLNVWETFNVLRNWLFIIARRSAYYRTPAKLHECNVCTAPCLFTGGYIPACNWSITTHSKKGYPPLERPSTPQGLPTIQKDHPSPEILLIPRRTTYLTWLPIPPEGLTTPPPIIRSITFTSQFFPFHILLYFWWTFFSDYLWCLIYHNHWTVLISFVSDLIAFTILHF